MLSLAALGLLALGQTGSTSAGAVGAAAGAVGAGEAAISASAAADSLSVTAQQAPAIGYGPTPAGGTDRGGGYGGGGAYGGGAGGSFRQPPSQTTGDAVLDDGLNAGYLTPNPPPPPFASALSTSAQTSCVYSVSGHTFDMSPMRRTDHDFTGTTNGGYAYRFNVCGNTVKLCNQLPAPASKWRGTKCNNLGDASTQTISLLDGKNPGLGLRFSYSAGDICKRQSVGEAQMASRSVVYEVYCDPSNTPGTLRLIQELSMCEYVIKFDSAYACPAGSRGGRGWRWLFLFFFFVACYLGGGYYYNHKNNGTHGVEAIPHVRYWEQVPGLVKDGMAFSWTHGKIAAEFSYVHGQAAYCKLHEMVRNQYSSRYNSVPAS